MMIEQVIGDSNFELYSYWVNELSIFGITCNLVGPGSL